MAGRERGRPRRRQDHKSQQQHSHCRQSRQVVFAPYLFILSFAFFVLSFVFPVASSSRSPLTSADRLFPSLFALFMGRHSTSSTPQTDTDTSEPIDDTFHTFLVRAANPRVPIAPSADSGGAHAIAMRWPIFLRSSSNQTQIQTSTSKALTLGRAVLCCHPALLRQYVLLDKRAVPIAMYCPVPGAADAAILEHLMSTASSSSVVDGMPKSRVHRVVPMHALALRDRERMLLANPDKLLRFTFVRHPFTRALAVYRLSSADMPFQTYPQRDSATGLKQVHNVTKMMGDDESRRERAQRLVNRLRKFSAMGRVRASPLSFRLFLSLLTTHVRVQAYFKEQQQQQHSHFSHHVDDDDGEDMELIKSQADICAVGTFNYSFVGRVERFHHDLTTVNKWLGIRRTVLPIHHSSGAREAANEVFADHRTRQKAARLFRRDLQAFGFSLSEY